MTWRPQKLTVFDFEYIPDRGDGWPRPVCFVATNLEVDEAGGITPGFTYSGGWEEMEAMTTAPWDTGSDNVSVAFSGHTDLACFDALGWPRPARYVDLMIELRNLFNGRGIVAERLGLHGFCDRLGIPRPTTAYKDEARDLILAGKSQYHKPYILEYCRSDVDLTVDLTMEVFNHMDWRRAIGSRGPFIQTISIAQHRGIPLDVDMIHEINHYWPEIQSAARHRVNETLKMPVFDEAGTFKIHIMEEYLERIGLLEGWPKTGVSGRIRLTDQDLKDWSKSRNDFQVLYETWRTLKQGSHGLRYDIGRDGRGRAWANPFGTKTGRSAPREPRENKDLRGGNFIFSGARWVRGLIKPPKGVALAYIDWTSQEIQVAAALSADPNLMACYLAKDPYIEFARMAGAVPDGATKESHPLERDMFKKTLLSLGYGTGARALAHSLGTTLHEAEMLVRLHHKIFHVFWDWIERVRIQAYANRYITNPMGWSMHVDGFTKATTMGNWPVQSAGAAMLHIAAPRVERAGVKVLATIHDAILIESTPDRIHEDVEKAVAAMEWASRIVTGQDVPCRTDPKIIQWPDRYMDEGGKAMFDFVVAELKKAGSLVHV